MLEPDTERMLRSKLNNLPMVGTLSPMQKLPIGKFSSSCKNSKRNLGMEDNINSPKSVYIPGKTYDENRMIYEHYGNVMRNNNLIKDNNKCKMHPNNDANYFCEDRKSVV